MSYRIGGGARPFDPTPRVNWPLVLVRCWGASAGVFCVALWATSSIVVSAQTTSVASMSVIFVGIAWLSWWVGVAVMPNAERARWLSRLVCAALAPVGLTVACLTVALSAEEFSTLSVVAAVVAVCGVAAGTLWPLVAPSQRHTQ